MQFFVPLFIISICTIDLIGASRNLNAVSHTKTSSNNIVNKRRSNVDAFPRKKFEDCRVESLQGGDNTILQSNYTKKRTQNFTQPSEKWTGQGSEFAGIEVTGSFTSVHASFAVFAPGDVIYGQYSSAFVSVESGSDKGKNIIKAGWTVNPCVYGDTNIHFYTYYRVTGGGYCGYNHMCDDFADAGPAEPGYLHLNDVLIPSILGNHVQNFLDVTLIRSSETQRWTLTANGVEMGSWDGEFFGALNGPADTIRIGGEAYTVDWLDSSPPMGSGGARFKTDKTITAYVQAIKINQDESGQGGFVPQNPKVTESRCYRVNRVGDPDFFDGFGFFYGGRGGKDQETCVYMN